jgi:hypothetical protein
MSLQSAAKRSTAVGVVRNLRDRVAARLEPLTRRLAAVDRRLLQVARGSRLHAWLTAESDPDPVVIDLRRMDTVGPVLTLLDRLLVLVRDSRLAAAATLVADRGTAAPVRMLGLVWSLAFAASLLATIVGGGLTATVYAFHALGLLAGVVMLREHRDGAALVESPGWGTLLAVVAPPPHDETETEDQRER